MRLKEPIDDGGVFKMWIEVSLDKDFVSSSDTSPTRLYPLVGISPDVLRKCLPASGEYNIVKEFC